MISSTGKIIHKGFCKIPEDVVACLAGVLPAKAAYDPIFRSIYSGRTAANSSHRSIEGSAPECGPQRPGEALELWNHDQSVNNIALPKKNKKMCLVNSGRVSALVFEAASDPKRAKKPVANSRKGALESLETTSLPLAKTCGGMLPHLRHMNNAPREQCQPQCCWRTEAGSIAIHRLRSGGQRLG